MTGDVSQIYGIANVDTLSSKRQRSLPVCCSVYDLLNFTSELATHHLRNESARQMQAAIGTLVSFEFDLEGSLNSFGKFKDFFVEPTFTKDSIAQLVDDEHRSSTVRKKLSLDV